MKNAFISRAAYALVVLFLLPSFLLTSVVLSSAASAQDVNPALRPPKGDREAIVVFEDLQCPQCRNTAPVVREAGKTYKIPVVRYDFPLPMHNWSFDAAVIAHYFDAHSKQLGYEYRDYMFEHQPEITPQNMRSFSDKFAAEHKVDLPFVVDPQGKLAAEVNAEKSIGVSVGINHTPTIYIVSSKPGGKPFVEVTDRSQLFQMIDAMK
jgi:protein-disulfide isomerase